MCGIAGIIGTTDDKQSIKELLIKAEKVQLHRGPDYQGIVEDNVRKWNIGLAHQRLSILDLSEAGNQPMLYENGNGTIIFNGEIYNFKEIRTDLELLGYKFKSDTDTEVVLTALHNWGPDVAFSKFNGMWAIVWLDKINNRLILARDRVGIKPLHYFIDNKRIYFSSEIKAILEMAERKFNPNYQVVGEYLIQSLLEVSNQTFFEGIEKIPPAHFGVIDLLSVKLNIKFTEYWDISSLGKVSNELVSEEELIEEIRELFIDSVRLRLRSDVPVGVLLSGGIDSSSIATIMQHILGKDSELNLLSAVSNDSLFDETPFIDIMGNYLNRQVKKVPIELKPEKAFDYLSQVNWYNDEPVGSFSNIAHFLLLKEARENGITVILSGQGADELLGGYKKYLGFYTQYLLNNKKYIKAARLLSSFAINKTIIPQFSLSEAKRYLPKRFRPDELDIKGDNLQRFSPLHLGLKSGMSVQERQALDVQRFSVPVLTHYEDRMSMAWSREIRVPFLDYRLVDKLISLPMDKKLNKGWTKYIFRKAMEPYLPKEIVWRKDKQGFVNPQSEWLKNELKDGVLSYFENDSLIFKSKIVNRDNLLQNYEEYSKQSVKGGNIWFRDIFNPLSMEIWLRNYEKYLSL